METYMVDDDTYLSFFFNLSTSGCSGKQRSSLLCLSYLVCCYWISLGVPQWNCSNCLIASLPVATSAAGTCEARSLGQRGNGNRALGLAGLVWLGVATKHPWSNSGTLDALLDKNQDNPEVLARWHWYASVASPLGSCPYTRGICWPPFWGGQLVGLFRTSTSSTSKVGRIIVQRNRHYRIRSTVHQFVFFRGGYHISVLFYPVCKYLSVSILL